MSTPFVLSRGLIDDAAIFPPGELPLPEAVRAHLALRLDPWLSRLVGPMVIGQQHLADTQRLASAAGAQIDVSVIGCDATALPDVISEVAALPALRLDAAEIPTRPGAVAAVSDLVAIGAQLADARHHGTASGDLPVFVEVGWAALEHADDVARAAASVDLLLKFRTGGVRADLFPTTTQLATAIAAAVKAGTAFKCTAGLHEPLRHRDGASGFEHHGFVNILAATVAARRGEPFGELARILSVVNAQELLGVLASASDAEREASRQSFRSYGSCSIDEPVAALVELGLIEAAVTA